MTVLSSMHLRPLIFRVTDATNIVHLRPLIFQCITTGLRVFEWRQRV